MIWLHWLQTSWLFMRFVQPPCSQQKYQWLQRKHRPLLAILVIVATVATLFKKTFFSIHKLRYVMNVT